MRLFALTAGLLVACDGSVTIDDRVDDTDTDPSPTEVPVATPPVALDGTWEVLAACGSARMLASNGSAWVAIEADLAVGEAVRTGEVISAGQPIGVGATLRLFDRPVSTGDLCGSIEELPGDGSSRYWTATAGLLFLEFAPNGNGDADGQAVVGELSIEGGPLSMGPVGEATGEFELPAFEWTGPLRLPDLPA